jgi:MFS family permease
VTRPRGITLRFYAAAAGVGVAFANINVAIPLQVNARHGSAALTGALLGASTLAIAVGAVAAGLVAARLGGGPRTLAAALGVATLGGGVFALGDALLFVACGGILVGLGIGMFWVASQLVLGGQSGDPGSELGFIVHFASYTSGAVCGATLTGASVAIVERLGLAHTRSVALSGLVGAVAAAAALVQWLPRARWAPSTRIPARALAAPGRHLTIQLADLCLVGALALILPLTPLVLSRVYHFGPLPIGLVVGGVSVAKIAGTFTAGRLTRMGGHRRSIVFLLALGASLCVLLCLALGAPFYVASLLAATLAIAGAWPVVVDAAQARVPPESRLDLTVLWNVREYASIAGLTTLAGSAYGAFGSPVPLFAAAGVLVLVAATSSAVVLRRPVWRPVALSAAV